MKVFLAISLYIVLAPVIGGILSGLDRIFSARLQGRVGPPVFQPFYDVAKLLSKETVVVRRSQGLYILYYLIFVMFAGGLFFAGRNLLIVVFALTLADVFLVLGAHKASSSYSFIGAQRELIQIMSYEPALLFTAIGMYLVTGSFYVSEMASFGRPIIVYLPAMFLAFIYVQAIKFRKSPFDLSTSHHAHQELVKGVTTEFSGKTLAMIEIAHWYETVLVLGIVYLFFGFNAWLAAAVALCEFFAIVMIDNVIARARLEFTFFSSWIVALIFGMGNIIVLSGLSKMGLI